MMTNLVLGLIVGAILAFTGAGGGILAVPALVFGAHLGVAQAGPIGLLAVGMAAALIGAEQLVLFLAGDGGPFDQGQVGIALQDALLGTVGQEALGRDADRHTGLAGWADRAIDDVVAAAEAGPGKRGVEFGGAAAIQAREQLALDLPGNIGAG